MVSVCIFYEDISFNHTSNLVAVKYCPQFSFVKSERNIFILSIQKSWIIKFSYLFFMQDKLQHIIYLISMNLYENGIFRTVFRVVLYSFLALIFGPPTKICIFRPCSINWIGLISIIHQQLSISCRNLFHAFRDILINFVINPIFCILKQNSPGWLFFSKFRLLALKLSKSGRLIISAPNVGNKSFRFWMFWLIQINLQHIFKINPGLCE